MRQLCFVFSLIVSVFLVDFVKSQFIRSNVRDEYVGGVNGKCNTTENSQYNCQTVWTNNPPQPVQRGEVNGTGCRYFLQQTPGTCESSEEQDGTTNVLCVRKRYFYSFRRSCYNLWLSWEPCSVKCGTGWQKRYRFTSSTDYSSQTQNCNLHSCPSWGEWNPSGSCQSNCLQIHVRECLYQGQTIDSQNCSTVNSTLFANSTHQWQPCVGGACTTTTIATTTTTRTTPPLMNSPSLENNFPSVIKNPNPGNEVTPNIQEKTPKFVKKPDKTDIQEKTPKVVKKPDKTDEEIPVKILPETSLRCDNLSFWIGYGIGIATVIILILIFLIIFYNTRTGKATFTFAKAFAQKKIHLEKDGTSGNLNSYGSRNFILQNMSVDLVPAQSGQGRKMPEPPLPSFSSLLKDCEGYTIPSSFPKREVSDKRRSKYSGSYNDQQIEPIEYETFYTPVGESKLQQRQNSQDSRGLIVEMPDDQHYYVSSESFATDTDSEYYSSHHRDNFDEESKYQNNSNHHSSNYKKRQPAKREFDEASYVRKFEASFADRRGRHRSSEERRYRRDRNDQGFNRAESSRKHRRHRRDSIDSQSTVEYTKNVDVHYAKPLKSVSRSNIANNQIGKNDPGRDEISIEKEMQLKARQNALCNSLLDSADDYEGGNCQFPVPHDY